MYRFPLWFVVINFDVTHLNVLLREIINVFLNKSSNYEKNQILWWFSNSLFSKKKNTIKGDGVLFLLKGQPP